MRNILGQLIALCLVLSLALLPARPVRADQTPSIIPEGEIQSTAAVLMDAESGQVLWQKNPDKLLYPASTTKVMTGWLASELCDPGTLMTAADSAIDPIPRYTSHIAIDYGEQLTVRDALYALMLPSANDAANLLAEEAAGSQEAFVELMNRRAGEIGAGNTHFVNAHGLHDSAHVTTAYDLALITRGAYLDGGVMPYMSAPTHTIGPTNKQSAVRDLHNQQFMLVPGMWVYNRDVIAGKVGYTTEARYTMTTVARRGERTLICVVLETGYEERFEDTELLLNYGFEQFTAASLRADELTGGSDRLAAQDTTVLLHHSVDAGVLEISLDESEPAATLTASGVSVPGLPEELLRVPLEPVEEADLVTTAASLTLRQPQSGFSWGEFAKGVGRVVLWTVGVLLILTILILLRRVYVVKQRRRRRMERIQRLQRARRER